MSGQHEGPFLVLLFIIGLAGLGVVISWPKEVWTNKLMDFKPEQKDNANTP